jgi:hypothetical protein
MSIVDAKTGQLTESQLPITIDNLDQDILSQEEILQRIFEHQNR